MTTVASSHRVERFRFASFDPAEASPAQQNSENATQSPLPAVVPDELPLPPVIPSFTEQDLQTARAESKTLGYREGYGAAEAKMNKEAATREASIRSLLEVIANRITIAGESHGAYLKSQSGLMEKLVIASARKVAGEALKREPYTAIESLLRECQTLIAGTPKITIFATPTLAAGLRQRVDTLRPLLPGFEGEIMVAEESALFDEDCRVEWHNGNAQRSTEKMWADIEAIIARTPLNT